jgi:hypothetical protein
MNNELEIYKYMAVENEYSQFHISAIATNKSKAEEMIEMKLRGYGHYDEYSGEIDASLELLDILDIAEGVVI